MNKKPAKHVVLYMAHFPLIVLIAILALAGTYTVAKNSISSNNKGNVLSDEDKDEDKDEEDGKDEDKDDDKKSSNSGSGSRTELEDEDENEVENEIENKDDDSEELNEVENEIENEFDDRDSKTKTLERVENLNGTISFIQREIENGKIKIEIRTYDANGNKIEESKVEQEGDKKAESKIKEFDALGNLLNSFELKTEDGNALKLKIKQAESPTLASKVKYDLWEQEIEVELEDETENEAENELGEENGTQAQTENRLRIRVRNNKFELVQGANAVLTSFPITIDPATGQVFVTTPNGDVELKEMPDAVVQKALANLDTAESVDLDSFKKLEYKIKGSRSKKLLGLFPITIPVTAYYDAQTGQLVEEQVSLLNKLLGIISF